MPGHVLGGPHGGKGLTGEPLVEATAVPSTGGVRNAAAGVIADG